MKTNSFIPIDVLSAEVSTATIEIKTLTIGRKQVTLAVFRQLDQEDLVVDTWSAALGGVPWGRVNYCPSKACAGVGEHLHVVWQKGTELRRATVPLAWPDKSEVADERWVDRAVIAERHLDPYLLALVATGGAAPPWEPGRRSSTRRMTIGGVVFERSFMPGSTGDFPSWPLTLRYALDRGTTSDSYRQMAADDLKDIATDGVTSSLVETLRQELSAKLDEYNANIRADQAHEAAYVARYRELETLPLLFIAV